MIDSIGSAIPFTVAGLRRGFVAGAPFILGNGLAGIAMGVAYRGLGLDATAALLFSTAVYSGTAQGVTLGLWAVPPPIPAMVMATLVTNARYLVMGAHLRRLFADVPARVMLPVLALLADASWLMTTAEAGRGRRDVGYLLGSSLSMAIGWIGGTGLGHSLPLRLHGAWAAAVAFLPLVFVVALLPTQWRGRHSLVPWAISGSVALLVAGRFGTGWAMLLGGGAGTLVGMLRGDDA